MLSFYTYQSLILRHVLHVLQVTKTLLVNCAYCEAERKNILFQDGYNLHFTVSFRVRVICVSNWVYDDKSLQELLAIWVASVGRQAIWEVEK